MAKGQHLSSHQQGIVKRYYQNLDTLSLNKLSELVSDLALATDAKAADRLWKRAGDALARAGVDSDRAAALVASRDVKALAAAVGNLWTAAQSGPRRS